MNIQKLIVFLFLLLTQSKAFCSGYTLRVGTGSMGTGQANPITFASAYEYEFTYNTPKNYEYRVSPGAEALAGVRFQNKNSDAYISLGGGVLYDFNSLGAGIYSALGYDIFCWGVCLSVEYLQTAGYGKSFISPYFLRIGIGYWSK